MANQIAITPGGMLFLGLPRYSADFPTPSLARQNADGIMQPFPDNEWNTWQSGDDGSEAFVYLNSVHVFSDETVWCVDQGSCITGFLHWCFNVYNSAYSLEKLNPYAETG
ncbi:hypothetical protein MUU48_20990 [Scandinavium sp. H11S7]|uniref:hypothetical protein n=1 Tax=Scandinavium hiltneri TaxID=2926519 RepID=UPI002166AC02|nr:hypothetical protein [Scandinavium hiltneri]MCS2159353.1 hypothetical protein [Scandinavium hiltneri]